MKIKIFSYSILLLLATISCTRSLDDRAEESGCNSLVDRYTFMTDLDRSYKGAELYNSEGYVLDESELYCDPFIDSKVGSKIKDKYVQLTQSGYYEQQAWYKIRYLNKRDSLGVKEYKDGYIKQENVFRKYEKRQGHGANTYNDLYYTMDTKRSILYLKARNNVNSGYYSFALMKNPRQNNIFVTYIDDMVGRSLYDMQSLYFIQTSGGECGAYEATEYLVLVSRYNGEISPIYKKNVYSYDSGDSDMATIYITNGDWRKKEPIWGDIYSPNTFDAPEKFRSRNYIYITETITQGIMDKNGEYVLDEYNSIKYETISENGKWYKILSKKMEEVKE